MARSREWFPSTWIRAEREWGSLKSCRGRDEERRNYLRSYAERAFRGTESQLLRITSRCHALETKKWVIKPFEKTLILGSSCVRKICDSKALRSRLKSRKLPPEKNAGDFFEISSREISPGSADERSHVRMFTCIASLIVFTSKNDQRSTICRMRKTEARDTNFVKRGREVYNTGKYCTCTCTCTAVRRYTTTTLALT